MRFVNGSSEESFAVYRSLDLQHEGLKLEDDAVPTNFEANPEHLEGQKRNRTRRGKLGVTDQATAYM